MRKLIPLKILLVLLFAYPINIYAQDEPKPRLLVDVGYFLKNNEIPYVTLYSKAKDGRRFLPVSDVKIRVYINEEEEQNLLGTIITDSIGKGVVYFSPLVKAAWDSGSEFNLIAVTEPTGEYKSTTSEITVVKAKIDFDTSVEDDLKTVTIRVLEKKDGEWVPAVDTETKLIVKRMVGNLLAGDDESYTTDENGEAEAEFVQHTIPGDKDGNIILIAKTEDHELYGSISIEKTVKWGVPFVYESKFDQRTLFATRDKAPIWLLLLAGGIVISVWSVIVYLVFIIFRIFKLGKSTLPT